MKQKGYTNQQAAFTDSALLKELCHNLQQIRLDKNLSQEAVAKISGLSRITVSRMEAGRSSSLLTFIQVLRALDKLDLLNVFKHEHEISPIQLLKIQERQRKRAGRKTASKKKNTKPGSAW